MDSLESDMNILYNGSSEFLMCSWALFERNDAIKNCHFKILIITRESNFPVVVTKFCLCNVRAEYCFPVNDGSRCHRHLKRITYKRGCSGKHLSCHFFLLVHFVSLVVYFSPLFLKVVCFVCLDTVPHFYPTPVPITEF